MSFNRRGGYDRRPDRPDRRERPDRGDRPPRREGGGDWQPRDRGPGGGSYGGGGRSFGGRPRFDRGADEGGMSIRLDPRRLGALKQLAGDAGVRPGDLVRQWVEERIDTERGVAPMPAVGTGLAEQLEQLAARVAALEASAGLSPAHAPASEPTATEPAANLESTVADDAPAPAAAEESEGEPEPPAQRRRTTRASATPSERVALHDEIIAVIRERGPMTSAELAAAITERGRYAPPRSGKPLDAAMVSQRVSNPTYRARFVRDGGRIGLAEINGT